MFVCLSVCFKSVLYFLLNISLSYVTDSGLTISQGYLPPLSGLSVHDPSQANQKTILSTGKDAGGEGLVFFSAGSLAVRTRESRVIK